MFTFAVLVALGFAWYVTNAKFQATKLWKYRRMRSAYSWAFVGAIIGSYFGVAGMGSAIAGTPLGAILGYLCASNLMKKDSNPIEEPSLYSQKTSQPSIRVEIGLPKKEKGELQSRRKKQSTIKTKSSWSWESVISYGIIIALAFWYFTERYDVEINVQSLLSQLISKEVESTSSVQSEFETFRTKYENQYPQINPRLPQYNPKLANEFANRVNELNNAGNSLDRSFEIAVLEIMQESQRIATPSPTRIPNSEKATRSTDGRACEFKRVMTNEDYLACGIQPPNR